MNRRFFALLPFWRLRILHFLPALILAGWLASAAVPDGYQIPPPSLVSVADAPLAPVVTVSPDQQTLSIGQRPGLPPIAELAEPELRLAGLRINPVHGGSSRSSYFTGLSLLGLATREEKPVTGFPAGARLQEITWSPDSRWLAVIVTGEREQQLWLVDARTAIARRLPAPPLLAPQGKGFAWWPDSRSLICATVPEGRPAPPAAPAVPATPTIQETAEQKAAAPTYQDLLKNSHDEILLEYFLRSRLVRVTLDGQSTPLGQPGLFTSFTPAPGGKYLLVQSTHRPFSYLVPLARFPRRVEIWDETGKPVKTLTDQPLAENIPIGSDAVRDGARLHFWCASAPDTICWVEALDGGDPKNERSERDALGALAAPFDGPSKQLAVLGYRFSRIWWGERLALLSESWRKTRRERLWQIFPAQPAAKPALLYDLSSEDHYADPGDPLTYSAPGGQPLLLTADGGESLFFTGTGASPEGSRPFLDKYNLASKKSARLWQSRPPCYESVACLLDPAAGRLLLQRESVTEPPNYFLQTLRDGELTRLTHFPHPAPLLKEVKKELIQYRRSDGVSLTATLYLPPGYTPASGPLPVLMWAYPTEYKSSAAAGQVNLSPCRFVRTDANSLAIWSLSGYAVLDNPAMPIIGEGDTEPNDTYLEQLVASARAAVDELVRRGIADPERIAIGGHSYGAFMTANLLAHSDLFACGIARSGAYNRTLTPFGFQAEDRTLWEAPEVYLRMSPFMHAAKINEPILLIHGEADNNQGTFPLQSERFYNAIKGLGGTARLVLLPFESHGYRARESTLHVLWEMNRWLELHLKGAKQ